MQPKGIVCEHAARLDIGTGGCDEHKIFIRIAIDQATDRNNTQSIRVIALTSPLKSCWELLGELKK